MDESKLTEDFLVTLVEVVRTIGWSRDYTELALFVEDVHAMAGRFFDCPEPYEDDPAFDGSTREIDRR